MLQSISNGLQEFVNKELEIVHKLDQTTPSSSHRETQAIPTGTIESPHAMDTSSLRIRKVKMPKQFYIKYCLSSILLVNIFLLAKQELVTQLLQVCSIFIGFSVTIHFSFLYPLARLSTSFAHCTADSQQLG